MPKKIDIKELNKLIKELDRLGLDVKTAIKKGVVKTGYECEVKAKSNCPFGKTGQLRNSIHTSIKENSNEIVAEVEPNVEYAVYVEFGTGPTGKKTNKNTEVNVHYKADKWKVNIPNVGVRYTKGQTAKPFMYPAFTETREKLLPNIKNELDKILKGAK